MEGEATEQDQDPTTQQQYSGRVARADRKINPLRALRELKSDACLVCGERHPTGDLAQHAMR